MALLYMVTAMGFAVNLHHCNNQIADIKINAPLDQCIDESEDACAKTMAMAAKKMDCRDSHLTIKVKDDHQKNTTSFHAWNFVTDFSTVRVYDYLFLGHQEQSDLHADRGVADTPITDVPIFLKNCIFRI